MYIYIYIYIHIYIYIYIPSSLKKVSVKDSLLTQTEKLLYICFIFVMFHIHICFNLFDISRFIFAIFI